MHYLNEVIRDISNLDSADNTTLMEQAFSFNKEKSPKIQVNKLQTTTEKDIQSGVLHLLKGACLDIRNPRSHERYNDDKLTADSIILFYNYVLSLIRNSEQPKIVEDWAEFIYDKNFVPTNEYATLVLRQIPPKKRYDVLISIFRERENYSSSNLKNIINQLIYSLSPQEMVEF